MEMFVLHFFKEKKRDFDYERLLSFFEEVPETTVSEDQSKEFRILYRHPILKSKADFVISQKSTIKELYKLDPQYLDVNFRLEIPLLMPNFSVNIIFKIVKDLCKEFNFYCYHDLFEDVLPFRLEVVMRVYEISKQHFKEKFGYLLDGYYYCPEAKLNECLKYVNEQYDLHRYYKEQNVIVPNYFVSIGENDKVHFTMEWKEGTRVVFPPHIDYIYYRFGLDTKTLPYDEVMAKIEKFTENVPGFIENTKVISLKRMKKIDKIIKKSKFTQVKTTLTRIELDKVIDIPRGNS